MTNPNVGGDQRTRTTQAPCGSAQTCTTATSYVAGKRVLISCTVSGTIVLNFEDGTTFTPTLPVGVYDWPYALTGFTAGTATATVAILY